MPESQPMPKFPNPDIPFRLIAIAGDEDRIMAIADIARAHSDICIALMLRDPGHHPARVEALARYALGVGLPANVTLIGNHARPDGVSWLHLTSAQLLDCEGSPASLPAAPFGVSVHSLDEALRGAAMGASYLILSPIFPTSSKPGHPGIGVDALRRLCAAVRLPLFALGGIDAASAPDALEAGAYGVAAISLFAPEKSRELDHLFMLLRGIPSRAAGHNQ